jgi:hypothetical protein
MKRSPGKAGGGQRENVGREQLEHVGAGGKWNCARAGTPIARATLIAQLLCMLPIS